MKILFLLITFLFSSLTSLLSSDTLKVGMELSYPPFEMICTDGAPCGISIDIANALGKYLNKEIVIENIPFIGLIPSLKTGRIDLIISSLTVTPERIKSIDFSEPYAINGLSLLVNKNSSLQSIKEANSPTIKIVVKSGTSGELYAKKNLTQAIVRILDKESMCILEVTQGKADAFIYDQISVYTNWQKNLATTRAILTPFQKEAWAVGIKKGNEELLKQVNRFITEYRKEKGFEKIALKYLPTQNQSQGEEAPLLRIWNNP